MKAMEMKARQASDTIPKAKKSGSLCVTFLLLRDNAERFFFLLLPWG